MSWKVKAIVEISSDAIESKYDIDLSKQEEVLNKRVHMSLPSGISGEELLARISEFVATLED